MNVKCVSTQLSAEDNCLMARYQSVHRKGTEGDPYLSRLRKQPQEKGE